MRLRRTGQIVAVVVVLLLIAGGATAAPATGGAGAVTTYGVGPLRLNQSSTAAIRAFAGKPDRVEYISSIGLPSSARHAAWESFVYRFPRNGYAYYSFAHVKGKWLFEEFDTNLARFHTARGSRVGMSQHEAATRERVPFGGGCIDSGYWHYRDGYRYAVVVGIFQGRVAALHAIGPHPPLC